MTDTGPRVELDPEDQEELKEIIIEFLSQYEALYNYRIQKLIFYGEIYTAQHFGERLTDASFMPYHHGPYSFTVEKALDQLLEEGRICLNTHREGEQYMTSEEHGRLSSKKRTWIKNIHKDTRHMSTQDLVDFAKSTWLWRNFEREERIDFASYIDEVVPARNLHWSLAKEEEPASEEDVERLLL
ncbi:SocA family protein [Natrinema sp. DC36]|uniref:SocA family protein n=1 Tax=Natrinema sp. DC36 TaxID=2878680 RepID=UPI001CEFDC47|nr:SocA family protein [Natrinema sp. DC36]